MIYLAAAVFAILVSCCITGREGARCGEFYKDKNGWGIAFDKTEVRNRFFLYLSALPVRSAEYHTRFRYIPVFHRQAGRFEKQRCLPRIPFGFAAYRKC